MFGFHPALHDTEDPLEGHPRYDKIRWADLDKPNVQIALDRQSRRNVAIKFIERGPAITRHVRGELLHHQGLAHEHVVQFLECFLTEQYLCIVMELGEQNLWQYVAANGGRLGEVEARDFFCQLISGLDYIHAQGIANRDIKLDNAILKRKFLDGKAHNILKICDFGYCHATSDASAHSVVGTSAYVSPEVVHQPEKGYDPKLADVWSCGVALYYMFEGRFPFGTEDDDGMEALFERIKSYSYAQPVSMSPGAYNLMCQIFVPEDVRLSVGAIKEHWWVRQGLQEREKMGLTGGVVHQSAGGQSRDELERIVEQARTVIVPPPQMSDLMMDDWDDPNADTMDDYR